MARFGILSVSLFAAAIIVSSSDAFLLQSRTNLKVSRRASDESALGYDRDRMEFKNKEDYFSFLEEQGDLPAGFRVGSAGFKFNPDEVPSMNAIMNVTVIALDNPSPNWAAVFTKNLFPGAPVIIGRSRLANGGPLQGIVINNKVSNVFPGGKESGLVDSKAVCAKVAEIFGFNGGEEVVLPSSTGVIGWRLPTQAILENIPSVIDSMQRKSLAYAARSIMTTDRFPKLRSCMIGKNGARIVGIAKGAGMIEPNMATMLVYILTDLDIPKLKLQSLLSSKVDASFNCISVDSDTSTSDTVVLLSSCKVAVREGDIEEFEKALEYICLGLAQDVVRNGEGTTHVMEVLVKGAPSRETARKIGKEIINSPLFKCAVAGNDPNVGRLLAVVGRTMANLDPHADMTKTRLYFGDREVYRNMQFSIDSVVEEKIYFQLKNAEMLIDGEHVKYPPHMRNVKITVDLGIGTDEMTVFGSDLTTEYVRINADYRS